MKHALGKSNKLNIQEINQAELKSVYEVMKELRPHISFEVFTEMYGHAKKADDYTLYGYYLNSHCVALMGLRYLHDYVHQYHLYIDDLVVTKDYRSQKIGAELLKFAEDLAVTKKCTGLRLSTGAENKDGIRFYEKQSWAMRAVVFKKRV